MRSTSQVVGSRKAQPSPQKGNRLLILLTTREKMSMKMMKKEKTTKERKERKGKVRRKKRLMRRIKRKVTGW